MKKTNVICPSHLNSRVVEMQRADVDFEIQWNKIKVKSTKFECIQLTFSL